MSGGKTVKKAKTKMNANIKQNEPELQREQIKFAVTADMSANSTEGQLVLKKVSNMETEVESVYMLTSADLQMITTRIKT